MNTITKSNSKRLLQIAVPIMLSNIISQVQMLIDRIFLGRLNPLNMSALGNVSTPMWATMSFCFAIAIGATILISQNVGAKNMENAHTYAAALIKWCSLLPVLLFFFWLLFARKVFTIMGVSDTLMPFCLDYSTYFVPIFLIIGFESALPVILQTSNYTKPLVYFGVIRSVLNIILDYILIFGKFGIPALGIKGAAIATTIAEYGGLFLSLLFIERKRMITLPPLKKIISAPFSNYFRTVVLGINSAFEDLAWNFGNIIMMLILNSINELAAGIYSIVFSVEVLAVVIIGAIGNGTLTLAGEAIGKKDPAEFKSVCIVSYLTTAVVSSFTLILCLSIPRQIISLFTKDSVIIGECAVYLFISALNLFSKSGNITIGSAIRGYGLPQWMLCTQIFGTVFIIGMASLFVFVFHMGIIGVFLAVLSDEFVRCMANLLKLRSIQKKLESQAVAA